MAETVTRCVNTPDGAEQQPRNDRKSAILARTPHGRFPPNALGRLNPGIGGVIGAARTLSKPNHWKLVSFTQCWQPAQGKQSAGFWLRGVVAGSRHFYLHSVCQCAEIALHHLFRPCERLPRAGRGAGLPTTENLHRAGISPPELHAILH